MKQSSDIHAWWSRLRHHGLLISPAVMVDWIKEAGSVPWRKLEGLRQAHLRFVSVVRKNSKDDAVITEKAVLQFVDWLIEVYLDFPTANVRKQGQFDDAVTAVFQIGNRREPIRPHRVIDIGDTKIPLMVDTNLHVGRGRGRTSYARLVELLRATGIRLGILTNGFQFRLVYAGMDTESWCEWEIERWFDQAEGEGELGGLGQLLAPAAVNPPEPTPEQVLKDPKGKRPLSLLEAVEESRKRQADLSSVLGESVRRAVEHLTDELSMEGRRKPELLETIYVSPDGQRLTDSEVHDALLQATVRVVMRCVVCLFAESRGLFPVGSTNYSPIYAESYSIKALFEWLDAEREHEGSDARLYEYKAAWARLIALFRLIHEGSKHPDFPMPRYGGLLFRPGSETDADPVLRALSVLEHLVPVSDFTVYNILRRLLRGKLPVIVGRVRTEVEGPVDYTQLRTEFIGIIYEGLLDYKLKRATDNAQVFLNIGREPVLPLDRLEGMLKSDPKGLKDLLTKLSKEKVTGKVAGEGEDDEVEDDEEEVGETAGISDEIDGATEAVPTAVDDDATPAPFSPEHLDADQRARAWTKEAVKVAGLAPKKRKAESEYAYDKRVEAVAKTLIRRVVANGEFFLVRAGNVRKGSGTFYTKPQLAIPTVHRTLEPLCYNADKTPKTPDEILNLKVCDPACGSASFLVAALHYLTEALYKSLVIHRGLEDPDQYNKVSLPFGRPIQDRLTEEMPPYPPDDANHGHDYADNVKALLRRHVVERCIFGVDINPLAVEFARVSLWVETMDEKLPFGFLDHKIKVGNALVGCWLDRVLDYPIKAWEREGGDGKDGERTERIQLLMKGPKEGKRRSGDGIIKKEMRSLIDSKFNDTIPVFPGEKLEPIEVVAEARAEYDRLHSLSVWDADAREAEYRALQENPHVKRLRRAMDEWCAVWFWPMDAKSAAFVPTPKTFHASDTPPFTGGHGGANRASIIEHLAHSLKFFHWELEFPDVFTPERMGFDVMLGNPPWEVMKPISQEFFTNYDPLYRTYDKQEALRQQKTLFKSLPECAEQWFNYVANFEALSNWVGGVCWFTDVPLAKGAVSTLYKDTWLYRLSKQNGFSGKPHPFFYQGGADLNTYKMFLEIAHTLLSPTGRLGLIVPSSLYTDSGTQKLRTQFLEKCTWDWLFSFENRKKIFAIHSSFKFAAVIVDRTPPTLAENGGAKPLKAAFMMHELADWEKPEPPIFEFDRSLIPLFSPRSKSLPEVRTVRDLEIARKIYDHSFRIGDSRPGWKITYAREFDMTNDSQLFSPREKWEARGFKPDVFGQWIGPKGEVALPLYEGRMIGQFDVSEKGWVRGKGRTAVWREIPFEHKVFEPQFLMSSTDYRNQSNKLASLKMAMMDITSSTNTRTTITCPVIGFPANHKAPMLTFDKIRYSDERVLSAIMNSLVFDYVIRTRFGGLSLTWFVLEESPLPTCLSDAITVAFILPRLVWNTTRLTFIHRRFAPEWLKLKQEFPELAKKEWKQWWAVTEADRLRLRVEIDALCADLYGLDPDDFDWIVRNDPTDPKGFWRVDKQLPYEERLTGLAAKAFRALKDKKWTANSAAELSNDEFFDVIGIPELTNEKAARAIGHSQPLIMNRTGCHSWRPELFAADDPRSGWTWDHCRADAIALLGSEKALEKYLKNETTIIAPQKKSRKKRDEGQGELI